MSFLLINMIQPFLDIKVSNSRKNIILELAPMDDEQEICPSKICPSLSLKRAFAKNLRHLDTHDCTYVNIHTPKASRYVLRKGFPLQFYFGAGIETINPTLVRDLDS